VTFTEDALAEYISWQTGDKKILNRINQLIQSIQRDGFMQGIGKPEPLKGRKAYSRRIDDENRLVYIGYYSNPTQFSPITVNFNRLKPGSSRMAPSYHLLRKWG
jgi:toxin YoeB